MAVVVPCIAELKPSGSCAIRSATPDDAAGVLEAAAEVFATSPYTLTQPDEFTMTVEEERAFLSALEASPDEIFLIAADPPRPGGAAGPLLPGEGLGTLILRHPAPKRKVRHIVEMGMSVRSSHRGRGVGTAMLSAAIVWARTRPGLEIMTLAVYADNAAALALYRRLGFAEYGRLPAGCKHDDGSRWDQVLMRLSLRSNS